MPSSSGRRVGRYVLGLLLSAAMAASAVVALPAGQAAAVPPGTYVYVSNLNNDNVSVIDTVTSTVTATIPVGDGPQGVAATPNGTRVYVVSSVSENVSVIDTATNTVTAIVPVGDFPFRAAVTNVGNIPVPGDPVPTELKLKTAKKKGKGSKILTLTARLTAEGHPLQGEAITFTTDGTTLCTSTTDAQGRATCTVHSRQDKHTCHTATFTGDDTYQESSATACLHSRDKNEKDKEPSGPRTADDVFTPALSPAGR
ncbi:YncE family protein [Streptomyces kutzneri]|uniref:YncE family protein n=1 Tax=Streptomyces kutzneri TaxID=3051179 RepID=UPI0028D50B57|nr:YncE family protein [Streptomyces sp. DSM 40907]